MHGETIKFTRPQQKFSVRIFLNIADCEVGSVTSRVVICLDKCSNSDEFNYLPLTDEFEENVRQTGWIAGL
jgi:hypothetical protein